MVKHLIPKSLAEALQYLYDGKYQVIAGGTDLMVQNRSSAETPPLFNSNMLYISNIRELNYIKKAADQIHIGSMTPLATILKNSKTPQLLKDVIELMASPAIRNVATLGGNIANASPAGDSLVALYLLDAIIVVSSIYQDRYVPVEKLITGPKKTTVKQTELIKEIIIPIKTFTKQKWIKVGGRQADAISKVSFAGAITIKENIVTDFRISLGAIFKTVLRDRAVENRFKNITLKQFKNVKNSLITHYKNIINPIDDHRSNKEYRKKVALNMIEDFIDKI